MDWVVTDPQDTIVIEGERDRQGDYIFTAQLVGEYSFCFRCVFTRLGRCSIALVHEKARPTNCMLKLTCALQQRHVFLL